MARTNSVNYTGANQFPMANAAADIFKKEDLQVLAKAVDAHVHDGAGLGLPVAFTGVPAGSIPGTALANGAVTSAKIADGTIATVDLADASVTNAKLGSDTARLNLLTNGGFEVWQRGVGPFTVNGTTSTDLWQLTVSGADTLTISKETSILDTGSIASAKCVFTLSGGTITNLRQLLHMPEFGGLAGRTLSLSVRVRTNVASAVRIALDNVYSGTDHFTYSSYHTGDNTWQTLTVTSAIDPTATYAIPTIFFAASCTAYVDNAMLVVGSQYADYAPLHPADDLARCLRYYEIMAATANELNLSGYGPAGGSVWTPYFYKAHKAVSPTVTETGTFGVVNCGQPLVASFGLDLASIGVTVTALGGFSFSNNAAGPPGFTVEANP